MADPDVDDGTDPGERGTLVVRDAVAQRLAFHAAANTPGVQRHSSGLGKLTGRDLPRVRTSVAAEHVRAQVDIAVGWACSLPDVGAQVQRNVADELRSGGGFVVDAVDVAIVSIVTDSNDENGRVQ